MDCRDQVCVWPAIIAVIFIFKKKKSRAFEIWLELARMPVIRSYFSRRTVFFHVGRQMFSQLLRLRLGKTPKAEMEMENSSEVIHPFVLYPHPLCTTPVSWPQVCIETKQ